MAKELDTKGLFRGHFICWQILGWFPPETHNIFRALFWLYSLFINVVITVGYPLHLMVGLYNSVTMFEVMQNLSINITTGVCVLKTFAVWWQFRKVADIFAIAKRQDERIHSDEEKEYLKKTVYPPAQNIMKLFYALCVVVSGTANLSVIVNALFGKLGLMYQAYFPFDALATPTNFAIAHIYQSIGLAYICMQQLVNDTLAPAHLSLLGGRVHMLSMRVAKLGYDPEKTKAENNRELLQYIKEHTELLEYQKILEDIISIYMFIQILLASINMCFVLVFTVLFVTDPFTMAYYLCMVFALICEIMPSCYYGTILEDEFHDLLYALFSCNWSEQSLEFKKNLRIFAERAASRVYTNAWLFRINNNSLIIAYKNTYTFFALVMNMR